MMDKDTLRDMFDDFQALIDRYEEKCYRDKSMSKVSPEKGEVEDSEDSKDKESDEYFSIFKE